MSIFSIKILALITMFIDHIGEFFPQIPHVIFLRQIGRISAPLFLTGCGYGIRHTSSPKKYLARLYMLSSVMGIGNGFLIHAFPNSRVFPVNNFPSTIFLVACISFLYIFYENNRDKFKKIFLIFIFSQIFSICLFYMMSDILTPALGSVLSGIFPNIFNCEGGIIFIVLGFIIFKYCSEPKKLFKSYVIFCLIYLFSQISAMISSSIPLSCLFTKDVSWMMIFAAAFMLLCNGEKGSCGKYCKYLFYFFYPLHIWGLFLISNII